jgi:hypothetical protein
MRRKPIERFEILAYNGWSRVVGKPSNHSDNRLIWVHDNEVVQGVINKCFRE